MILLLRLISCLVLILLPNAHAKGGIPDSARSRKAVAAVSEKLKSSLTEASFRKGAPVFIQILKQESELRLFLETESGEYALFETYPICAWSGALGPKLKEGDGQSPEGFYRVRPRQLNPVSSYHLSFNLGYPNAYDRAHGRAGSYLMVHGNCVSIGCYAMTDAKIEEIWTLMNWAYEAGQASVPVHIFPFDMTEANLGQHQDNKWMPFWQNELKPAWDAFEANRFPPKIRISNRAYQLVGDTG